MNGYITHLTDTDAVHEIFYQARGRIAVDIGANAGVVANVLAENFELVYAYEPCDTSYKALVDNCAENVLPSQHALSSQTGMIELNEAAVTETLGELVTGTTLAPTWGETVGTRRVWATTLDHMGDELILGHVDFVKIDTEGHELRVVLGGAQFWQEIHPAFVIEVHDQVGGQAIETILTHVYGYEMRTIRHPGYRQGTHMWSNHYWLVST